MKALNKETAKKTVRPERIIQFGEGNFLRAFVDWIIYNMNEKADFNSSVVVVQPIDARALVPDKKIHIEDFLKVYSFHGLCSFLG